MKHKCPVTSILIMLGELGKDLLRTTGVTEAFMLLFEFESNGFF